MLESIAFRLNGKPVRLSVDGDRKALWVLRTELQLTGTKYGCGEGHCGACTVLRDGVAVRACLTSVRGLRDREVVTIEGLARGEALHAVQAAFVRHQALQCGFCTPGMILGAVSLLRKNPRPSREQIVAGMDHHLCRCGAYGRIVDAIESAAAELASGGGRP
jgi:aerobic-type carbon monoxide dehydrogenase small subunit (CoxS/CutS family)